jgi:hypothetical protein
MIKNKQKIIIKINKRKVIESKQKIIEKWKKKRWVIIKLNNNKSKMKNYMNGIIDKKHFIIPLKTNKIKAG